MRRRQLPGEPPPPTKTELKRQAHAVQALADRLVEAPPELVAGLGLPDKLVDAIGLARRITSRAALLRQRQYVAKLMRGLDPEPIRATLDASAASARRDAARFRRAERWRDRMVEDGRPAIAEFLSEFPGADRDELDRLAAAARRDRDADRPSGAARELFGLVSGEVNRNSSR
jgi:ribosome-associated protein